MRISYNWIKDLVPDLDLTPTDLAELLTMHSFETDVAGRIELDRTITIAKITKLAPYPNADRLRLATIDTGHEEITVVCGAPNINEGDVVPFSPPGTTLTDENGATFTLAEATIRGVASPGMLNSLRELGLGTEHSGIWLLSPDAPVGDLLADHFPADTILEADITPNRAHDCLSHIGIAREVAALLDLTVREPELPPLPEPQDVIAGWRLGDIDSTLCPRYTLAVLDSVTVAPTPLALQARLIAAGGKPINNLVDITNYVTFEYGNPSHAFDSTTLRDTTISVRPAKADEELTTLDDTTHQLIPDDVVITADDKPVALAGVMGGGGDEVTPHTDTILFEVANFSAYRVQETARRLALSTEASARFSKGLDPNLVTLASARAIGLLQEHANANLVGLIDHYPKPRLPQPITFDPDRVSKIAGITIDPNTSRDALQRLRCTVDTSSQPWTVTPTTDRLDLTVPIDLVEEVIRLTGLQNIPTVAPSATTPIALPDRIWWREVIRDTLVSLGFTETYNASFEPAQYADLFGLSDQIHLSLTTPPAPNLAQLRVSLLPGLLANLVTNRAAFQRHAGRRESTLFEIGSVFAPGEGGRVPGVIEREHLAGVIVGPTPSLAQIAEELGRLLDLDALTLTNQLPDHLARSLKYQQPITAFELSLSDLFPRLDRPTISTRSLAELPTDDVAPYEPISKFPAVYRDLSLLVAETVTIEDIQAIIERIGGKLLTDVDLFDEFHPTDTDHKSLAFHLTYQSFDKTLTDDEINKLHNTIIATLHQELGAQER